MRLLLGQVEKEDGTQLLSCIAFLGYLSYYGININRLFPGTQMS